MSTKYRSTEERIERIDDVRDLDVGDEVLFGDRSKPLVVRDAGSRPFETMENGAVEQHAVEVSGEWANANTYLLVNQRHFREGERTGKVILDMHHSVSVRRVGGDD
ncbi:hypothetical protein [Halopelagius fulvigenes]|uniref:Uncharacterized protein n=1 Tax=Halopelagius fulvigenes TaxID=1198324 RepID=A0ABD5U3H5_9EURY